MAFIRIKNIKTAENRYPYAYVVENVWVKKRVKQRVKKYLGRVYEFSREEMDFAEFVGGDIDHYTSTRSEKDILVDLVKWELMNHGFVLGERGKDLVQGNLRFNPRKKTLTKGTKDVVVASNEGLICTHLLKKFLKFNHKGSEEEKMYAFAKDLVELGIQVPKEVFIALYEKVHG